METTGRQPTPSLSPPTASAAAAYAAPVTCGGSSIRAGWSGSPASLASGIWGTEAGSHAVGRVATLPSSVMPGKDERTCLYHERGPAP
jgi:hypothetical protein